MERFIVVQVSPKRWVVAEKETCRDAYRVITKRMTTASEAVRVQDELNRLDHREYSELTVEVLLDL